MESSMDVMSMILDVCDEPAERQTFVDEEVNQLTAKYYQMMNNSKDVNKQLELSNAENILFKNIGLGLTAKVNELTGGHCNVREYSIDVYDVSILEESYDTLTNQLVMNKTRAERMSKELAEINRQLADSEVMQKYLTECCEKLTALSEVDQIRRDRSEVHEREMMKWISAQLDQAESNVVQEQRNIKQREDVLRKMMTRASVYSQKAKMCVDELRMDNNRLADELETSKAIVDALSIRLTEQEALQSAAKALDSVELHLPIVPDCPIKPDHPVEKDCPRETFARGKSEESLRNECGNANMFLELQGRGDECSASIDDFSADECRSYSVSFDDSSVYDEPPPPLSSSFPGIITNDNNVTTKPSVSPMVCQVSTLDQLIKKYASPEDINKWNVKS